LFPARFSELDNYLIADILIRDRSIEIYEND